MNERMICIPIPTVYPGAAAALGANFAYYYCRHNLTIVYVTAAPSADDTGLTLAINDDGSAVIAAFACADADVPGEFESTHVGGAEAPVEIAAGSKISFTASITTGSSGVIYKVAISYGVWRGRGGTVKSNVKSSRIFPDVADIVK